MDAHWFHNTYIAEKNWQLDYFTYLAHFKCSRLSQITFPFLLESRLDNIDNSFQRNSPYNLLSAMLRNQIFTARKSHLSALFLVRDINHNRQNDGVIYWKGERFFMSCDGRYTIRNVEWLIAFLNSLIWNWAHKDQLQLIWKNLLSNV